MSTNSNTSNNQNHERSSKQTSNINQPFNNVDSSQSEVTQYQSGRPLLSKEKEYSLTKYNHITYLLYILSFFTAGILWIVPIIMNYIRRRDADGTWLATHFDWQIKTFWYSLILGIIGMVILFLSVGGLGISALSESSGLAIGSSLMALVGGLFMLTAVIWHLYRIIRGWIALSDNRPVQ